ncbi:serine/threonine protein kinase, putative [Talaromyces stipitatus ATCC 10500]|uniref:Serine/threonine protein kinase, putative n=1 Tax=Talaromyces stipitatus (strain ATCC 10500 / CBS 375.48 / QM 6759 / NRRL 1006) TaxID=441959 RepID=B8MUQ1_TALSN|nr:serine/threonine protein kinase, putative [Talaromyces stipitatus ATCC 10500]EED11718.1 serine/threonine protein kinase, putative [Talaromyces stipitatus ATCC 10500]
MVAKLKKYLTVCSKRKHSSEIRITPDIVQAAATNEVTEEMVMRLLLDERGSKIQITPDIVQTAAKNEYSGEMIVGILESRRPGHFVLVFISATWLKMVFEHKCLLCGKKWMNYTDLTRHISRYGDNDQVQGKESRNAFPFLRLPPSKRNRGILYTPLVQGIIRDLTNPKNTVKRSTWVIAFRQLLQVLQWLHSHHLVHRDIKLVNIGIDLNPLHVSILDLGAVGKLDSHTGTVHYIAPEMESTDYNGKVDIWASAVGCEIFLGSHPWPLSVNPWRADKNPRLDEYKKHHRCFVQSLRQNAKSETTMPVLSLIADMLNWSPKARHSALEALEYQFFLDTLNQERQGNVKRRKLSAD